MLASVVHQEDGVEDLHGSVCVHGGIDLGNRAEIAIDEPAQPDVVLDSAAPGTTADKELEIG